MEEPERRVLVLHPLHRWQGIGIDREEFGDTFRLGWITVQRISLARLQETIRQAQELLGRTRT